MVTYQLNFQNVMKLYENIEVSTRHIENIRFHLQEIHRDTIYQYRDDGSMKKPYVLDWYQSQERFLNETILNELGRLGLDKLSSRSGVSLYFLDHDNYSDLKSSSNSFDYFRFKSLRNYFAIKRLIIANSRVEITDMTLVIEYRSGETSDQIFEGRIMDESLAGELQFSEDVQALISAQKLNYRSKIPSYLFPILFSNKFTDVPFEIQNRGPRRSSIKKRGYILTNERDRFVKIANKTEGNMNKLVNDWDLKKILDRVVQKFETRKTGA